MVERYFEERNVDVLQYSFSELTIKLQLLWGVWAIRSDPVLVWKISLIIKVIETMKWLNSTSTYHYISTVSFVRWILFFFSCSPSSAWQFYLCIKYFHNRTGNTLWLTTIDSIISTNTIRQNVYWFSFNLRKNCNFESITFSTGLFNISWHSVFTVQCFHIFQIIASRKK